MGFWFKAGQPDPATQELLAKLAGKKVFFFATHGAATNSDHAGNGMKKEATELAVDTELAGSFHCQGEVSEKVQAAVREKNPKAPWLPDVPAAAGHPDKHNIAKLQAALQ